MTLTPDPDPIPHPNPNPSPSSIGLARPVLEAPASMSASSLEFRSVVHEGRLGSAQMRAKHGLIGSASSRATQLLHSTREQEI